MFPIITLTGTAYVRGHHYGTQAAPQIRHSIASYTRLFAYRRGIDWESIQSEAQAYIQVLQDDAPDLLTEMRGIAEGSGRTLTEIVTLNARTELFAGATFSGAHPDYPNARERNRAQDIPDHGECTTVAALPVATLNGTTMLAQTWDWNGDQRAACVLLRIHLPDNLNIITLAEAGMVAKIGLNSAGLGVCLNILRSNDDGQRPGIPVHILLRRILQTKSIGEAVEEAARVQSAASSCITVADITGQAVSLEITPDGMGRLDPHDGMLVHTNHCIVETARANECAVDPASSTIPRFNRAVDLMAREHGHMSLATLIELLRDRHGAPNSICRQPDMRLHPAERPESVAGVVMDLPARMMYVAPGVPCDIDFEPVPL